MEGLKPKLDFAPLLEEIGDSRRSLLDLRRLILHIILPSGVIKKPYWCNITNKDQLKVVLCAINGATEDDYNQNRNCFGIITSIRQAEGPFCNLSKAPYIKNCERSILRIDCDRTPAAKGTEITPIASVSNCNLPQRNFYLLTIPQLRGNAFPGYVDVEDDAAFFAIHNESATPKSPMFALDCEMCLTNTGDSIARVALVDEYYNVIVDTYVLPDDPIIDYRTRYSGITSDDLIGVKIRLNDVHELLKAALPKDAILVGHSLENDLRAMRMIWNNIIDTSVQFSNPKSPTSKPSLKFLASEYLQCQIQENENGHSPVEDAITCPEFGRCNFDSESVLNVIRRCNKEGTLIDNYHVINQYYTESSNCFPCFNDDQIVGQSCKNASSGMADFTWIQLHEPAIVRKASCCSENNEEVECSPKFLDALSKSDQNIGRIYNALQTKTLFIVLLAGGDFGELARLKASKHIPEAEIWKYINKRRKCYAFFALKM
ncbi:Small RNA degrading nuclease 5 [Trichoplax sp. H2]|nr:Small RNA degrading nuclease 5 [Trichoplax sp. H2]|eukprot:RDD43910.1 Small RNA degrading nuclease 5 [Trichoplax sp. H2]